MLDKDLQRHAPEFMKALAANQYEQTEQGVFFPAAKVTARGLYIHDVNGEDVREDPNLLTDEGLTHMLAVVLGATAKISQWYVALYSGAISPAAGWTAATFPATANEITSSTEGYSESTRRLFQPGAATAATIDNTSNKAAFTIVTAGSLNVQGAALLSANVKGSTSGVLVSATRFSTPRVLQNTDIYNVGYRVVLTSS